MELILWRHADAEDGVPDAERKLTAKGTKQAQRMAAWLEAHLPSNTLVLASPARRARETAQALSRTFETNPELGAEATAQSVLDAVNWPRGEGAVVVVGHQPTLGQAVALALTGKPDEWNIKKGAIWWLESRADGKVAVRAVIGPDMA